MISEINHLMELSVSPQNVLSIHTGAEALNERIQEWFETPAGTVANLPSWGNTLAGLKHEPLSTQLEVTMEAAVFKKLSEDCGFAISGIRVDFLDFDYCRIKILYGSGLLFDSEVDRRAF